MDIGSTPNFKYTKEYQSGALSFEIITNGKKLISNCGYFYNNNSIFNKLSKSTAAQSTLVIDDNSSCKFINVNKLWLVNKGLKRNQAQQYITSLYSALAELAAVNSKKNLKYFVSESQTPGGLNWQGVNELRKSGYYKSLEKSINNILKRLNKK